MSKKGINMAPSRTELGKFIRNRRLELNLSLKELSELTGFTEQTLSNIETGKTKFLYNGEIKDFAEALKCGTEELKKLISEKHIHVIEPQTELGKLIKSRREELNLTIEEFAKKIGINSDYAKKLEIKKGPNIRSYKLAKPLAKFLNIEPRLFISKFVNKSKKKLAGSELGKSIREQREKLTMSIDSLAEKLSVSKQTLSALELGKHAMSNKNLKNIAEILGLDFNELKNLRPERKINKIKQKKNIKSKLAEFLTSRRLELNLTLKNLSELSGISITTILNLENKKDYNVKMDTLDKIAKALDCEIPQEIMIDFQKIKQDKSKTPLGDFITKKRIELSLNQKQIADKMGLNWWTISSIERGILIPKSIILEKLSEALECEIPAEIIPQPKPLKQRGRKKKTEQYANLLNESLDDIKKIKELSDINTDSEAVKKAIKVLRRLLEKQQEGFAIHLRKGDEIVNLEIIL